MGWYYNLPVAPWQDDAWRESMREQLGEAEYRRMILCDPNVASSNIFISADDWAAVEDANLRPILNAKGMPCWLGVDASLRHDSTAIAVCTWDATLQKVRLVDLRIFEPDGVDIDFEGSVEKTLLEIRDRFTVRSVRFDPYQLVAVAQRLTAAGLPMQEWAQTEKNLTDATTSLYTLIKGRNFVTYPDERLRKAIAHAVVKQTGRGWKQSKEKRQHKIDPVVALSFACMAAEREGPVTGDGADYVAAANLGPRRGPSVSLLDVAGELADYEHDDAAYIRDSRLEQAQWESQARWSEFGPDGSPDDAAIPFEGDFGSRRWRNEF